MLKAAIYGKGGIGKSTTVSNLSCALAKRGFRVLQIGCDPKADSTCNLMGGKRIPTILDAIREKGDAVRLEDIVYSGEYGVLCAEAGGPTPGRGCAGKGIVTAFERLGALRAYETYQPDVVLYDVLGDVVCGGFAMPLRGGYADVVLVVTSGEMMSLYAAGNICAAVREFSEYTSLKLGGLLVNERNIAQEAQRIQAFSTETGVDIFGWIPRSQLVQEAEEQGRTVVAQFPGSQQAQIYEALALRLLEFERGGDEAECI